MLRGASRFIVAAIVLTTLAASAASATRFNTQKGGNGPDVLYGTKGRDRLNGGHGPDVLYGFRRGDVLITGKGGPGDKAYGGRGPDYLENYSSGQAPGTMVGGPGRDECVGDKHDVYIGCEVIEYR